MSKSLLFVRIKSRLGLIHPPKGELNPNIGVEEGAEYVLSDEFVKLFPNREEINFEFTAPEQVHSANYYEVLAQEYTELVKKITTDLDPQKILVTVGGDHSISLGSVAAILHIFNPLTMGMIMIDSHGDIHQPTTSPSGNFHGMWLRPVVDQFEIPSINSLVPKKLPIKNLLYVGNLDIEPEEKIFIENNHINTFSHVQIKSPDFTEKLESFIRTMEHIHVSIDIDAFTHTFTPATGMMIKNGLIPDDVFYVLEKLKKCRSLSVDIVEVNPTMKGSAQTVALAQEILQSILKV